VAQNTNTNTEPHTLGWAAATAVKIKIVADRRPTTHDGIKTRTTGRFAEGALWLHTASFRGLQQRRAGQCHNHSSRLQARCS
jgi:hypothetical protein